MKKVYSAVVLISMMIVPNFTMSAEPADSTAMEKPEKESAFEAGAGVTLVSSYLWRGSQLDKAALQADASISWKGLTLDVWGSAGLVGGFASREIDLALSYEIKGFSIGLTDYFCPVPEEALFFSRAPHTLEVGVGYSCDYVAVNWYTNVFNDDQYSSYLEVSAPFSIGPLDFGAALGMSPYKSEFYGTKGFNVVNVSLTAGHEFEFGPCTIPLSCQLMFNPAAGAAFYAASIGIAF